MFSDTADQPFPPAVFKHLKSYYNHCWEGEKQTSITVENGKRSLDAKVILMIQANWDADVDELQDRIVLWLERMNFDSVVLWCDHAHHKEINKDPHWADLYLTILAAFEDTVDPDDLTLFIGWDPDAEEGSGTYQRNRCEHRATTLESSCPAHLM